MTERWAPVRNYLGYYEVSDLGRVRSLPRIVRNGKEHLKTRLSHGVVLKPSFDTRGYLMVGLSKDNEVRTRKVHHLVLEAFVGPRPEGMECCHNDGDKTNNRLSNLRWDTRQENANDRERHGRTARGERQGSAKLNSWRVRAIRKRHAAGWSQRRLARRFKVSRPTVRRVLSRKTWSWLG